ncbi:MAG: glutathione S-transferase N-terminal domain-containing protein [Gammaproteobacteria bacterium]|nr:glutathione S-transferase N-terminal domain-containing protein [Gammaproteobacteria bacterium]
MRLVLKALREGLGRLIILIDWFFSPSRLKRTDDAQTEVNHKTEALKLYQFYACPFCIKTRRAVKRLNLKIETRNAQAGEFREELQLMGGKIKVPCLKIEGEDEASWVYESDAIINYLEKRFA